jgi:hypothetical protein
MIGNRPGPPPSPDAIEDRIAAYKQGIDRTLLIANLRRTVEERIRNLMALQRLADEVRKGMHPVKSGK